MEENRQKSASRLIQVFFLLSLTDNLCRQNPDLCQSILACQQQLFGRVVGTFCKPALSGGEQSRWLTSLALSMGLSPAGSQQRELDTVRSLISGCPSPRWSRPIVFSRCKSQVSALSCQSVRSFLCPAPLHWSFCPQRLPGSAAINLTLTVSVDLNCSCRQCVPPQGEGTTGHLHFRRLQFALEILPGSRPFTLLSLSSSHCYIPVSQQLLSKRLLSLLVYCCAIFPNSQIQTF